MCTHVRSDAYHLVSLQPMHMIRQHQHFAQGLNFLSLCEGNQGKLKEIEETLGTNIEIQGPNFELSIFFLNLEGT